MAKKDTFALPPLAWMPLIVIALFFVVNYLVSPVLGVKKCPGSQVYCPGVGCVSGQDKCFAGSFGGASRVFSKETFGQWPGSGVRSSPPVYGDLKESFTSCPDGTRTDGPCLLQF